MKPWAQAQDEQLVLAVLLSEPSANRWELDGLEADLFTVPAHRQVAEALIHVRDRGVCVHWRRVKVHLRGHGFSRAVEYVEPLMRSIGTTAGLTVAISRLHHAREQRRAKGAA